MAESRKLDWPKLMDEALTAPGNLGNVYSRFHDYSLTNMLLFRMQGLREPVGSASTWKQLGRFIINWQNRKEVIVPRIVKVLAPKTDEDAPDEKRERVERLIGFKVVRAVFALSDTEGADPPPAPIPGWDLEKALDRLGIKEVPFASTDGNVQGYSYGLEFAINPVAVNRGKTVAHELGHIVLGHTMPHRQEGESYHRGLMEFEAEATAYLFMNELGLMDEETASHSRGYIRHWLQDEQPPEKSIQRAFRAADAILRAGRIESSPVS